MAKKTEKQTLLHFRDEIDKYLWEEHHVLAGCCSSVESLKYNIAREVAEKLFERIDKQEEAHRRVLDGIVEYIKQNK